MLVGHEPGRLLLFAFVLGAVILVDLRLSDLRLLRGRWRFHLVVHLGELHHDLCLNTLFYFIGHELDFVFVANYILGFFPPSRMVVVLLDFGAD